MTILRMSIGLSQDLEDFHAPDGMFDHDAYLADAPITRFLRLREVLADLVGRTDNWPQGKRWRAAEEASGAVPEPAHARAAAPAARKA